MAQGRPITGNDVRPKRTLAFLGHSFQAAAFGAGGVKYITGYPSWIDILSRQRVSIKNAGNFAVAGETSTQIVARVPSVIAAAPGACLIDMITNDTPLSFATTTGNLFYAIEAFRNTSIIPIVVLWTGRTGISTAQYQNFMRVNEWLKTTYRDDPGVILFDPAEFFIDPTTGTPFTAMTQEGLHPNNAGGYYFVQPLLRVLETLFPGIQASVSNPLDAYSADNPTGNIVPNGGMFTGTGGTRQGGVLGTNGLADGWTATDANAGGATVTVGIGTMSDGRRAQVVTISGTYTGNGKYVELTTGNLASSLLGGKKVEVGVDFEISAGAASICGVSGLANVLTGSGNIFPSMGGGNAGYPIPAIAYSGVLRNDRDSAVIPGSVAPSFASLAFRIGLVNAAGSTACALTLKLAAASLKGY